MKFNIEINIDWIDEDSSIDNEIKKQIIETVVSEVRAATVSDVSKKVVDILENQVETLVTETYNQILEKEIKITDKYGDVKKEYAGVKEMIKANFDQWLLQKVDSGGNVSASGYGDTFTRFDWFIKKHLDPMSKSFTQDMVKKLTAQLKNTLTEDMKELLGSKILEVVNVKQLLESAKS